MTKGSFTAATWNTLTNLNQVGPPICQQKTKKSLPQASFNKKQSKKAKAKAKQKQSINSQEQVNQSTATAYHAQEEQISHVEQDFDVFNRSLHNWILEPVYFEEDWIYDQSEPLRFTMWNDEKDTNSNDDSNDDDEDIEETMTRTKSTTMTR